MMPETSAVAEVKDCHLHRLCHTFATKLVMKGMNTVLARQFQAGNGVGARQLS